MRRFALLSIACSWVALACGSEPDEGRSGGSGLTRCVPNQTLVCTCGLDKGSQTCDEQGRLSKCECPDARPELPLTPSPATEPDDVVDLDKTCGNGVIDPGEACDDANRIDGDGCSATCQPDGAPKSADACPGQAVSLGKGAKVTLAGTTVGYADDLRATCFDSSGPDRVYAIQPRQNGFMTVDAAFGSGFHAVVEVRRGTCALSTAQVLCEDTLSRPFKNVVQVEKDKNYFLIVDGDSESSSGAYTIVLELQ